MTSTQRLKTSAAYALAALLLLMGGCTPDLSQRQIADLERMPQAPLAYVKPATASRPLLTPGQQAESGALYLERFFAAWHTSVPLAGTRKPFWAVDWIDSTDVFAENLRPVESERLKELIRQAAPESYPSLDRRAVAVCRCDLRALPTRRPLFGDPGQAGEGFPFDYLQHSALPANTPLHVTHLSRDGSWAFVETALVYGWMPVSELAWVDEGFVRTFETHRYLALVRENVAVSDVDGIYRFSAGVGTLLPLVKTGSDEHRILVAVADEDGNALLREATIPADSGEVFPLPPTPRRIAELAGRLVGQSYDWGGRFGGRDCSATVRDLFASFGLWLPRNSSRQALIGEMIPLSDLDPRQREARLRSRGIPFLTLVGLPGHIMLYIGEHEGRAAVLHTLWGLRTKPLFGREGRWTVGRTVITTLEPGMERDGLFLEIGDLRDRIESMNILNTLPGEEGNHGENH